MIRLRYGTGALLLLLLLGLGTPARAQDGTGSLRGIVYDKDFDVPLAGAEVLLVTTGQTVTTNSRGSYLLPEVASGEHTLVFRREGYVQQIRNDVVVSEGRDTELNAYLAGEFHEMEDMVVQESLQLQGGTESGLLELRFESPALEDSVSAELIGRSGVSDAAGAVRLVAGASLKDGKSAVIRGLPDRYVSSQMNGMRLPTADEDKRAVELDQFPSVVLEAVRIKKTFTPDQQGDASGGAVDIRLRGVPRENILEFKSSVSANSQVTGREDFLTYSGGGVNTWGKDDGGRGIQFDRIAEGEIDPDTGMNLGSNWDGVAGVKTGTAPTDYKFSTSIGGRKELDKFTIGGFANLFYERDSSFREEVDDSYWVTDPGGPLEPEFTQGNPEDGDFKTSLLDITRASQSVLVGSLLAGGIESEYNKATLTYLQTRTAEDEAILATDTRGKEYYFPGYDPDDSMAPGNTTGLSSAPYLRTETLEYTERTTRTVQFSAQHKLPFSGFQMLGLEFSEPKIEWTYAVSKAGLDQPDKRQFGALWLPPSFKPGAPPFIPPFTTDPTWTGFKPSANFTQGNFQRIFKQIEETSDQYTLNLELPFFQWSGNEGFFKFGIFNDDLERTFEQSTYTNLGDNSTFVGDWDEPWSDAFPFEDHKIADPLADIDYDGDQEIRAYYGMLDLPLSSKISIVGGARLERTDLRVVNKPESEFALWFPPDKPGTVESLEPGEADADISERNLLPSIAFLVQPIESLKLRASFSKTIARQTFKEITPILQQEFLGGPIFIGDFRLRQSELKNYDLRADFRPVEGSLISVSRFEKDIDRPIEYVQRFVDFNFTTPLNYPEGELDGWEFELRQDMGVLSETLSGLTVGANATLIDSEVKLTQGEIDAFASPAVDIDLRKRPMTSAPDYLMNLFVTYDIESTGTQFSAFYTRQGDTLLVGAGLATNNFVPSVYAKEFDTLNFSVNQRLGEIWSLKLAVKNITNPEIETVYRSKFTGPDVTNTKFRNGIEYSLGLGASFRF